MSYESPSKSSSVDKPVKTEEKSSAAAGDSYADLTGMVVGKGHDDFGGPTTVTIQLTGGGASGDLVLTLSTDEAKKVPNLLDKEGKHLPPIPVKIKVMPGEGAPPPGTGNEEEEEAKDEKDKPKEKAKEPTKESPPVHSGGTY